MNSLEGRVAVVTGAGRGIGKEIARQFAEAGAKVAVVSYSEGSCGAAAEEINGSHAGSCKAYAVDVADNAAAVETGKEIIADLGGADILVNNAGVTRDNLALRMTEEEWDTVLDTNLKGAFNMVKAVQRPLLKSKSGRIINISSVVGLTGNAGQLNYAASKAGLIGFTKSLAREFAGRKVTSNAIAPGFIATDMTDDLGDDVREKVVANIPLGFFGEVGDVAGAALFLAAESGRYITGQVLTVDGGMVI